MNSVSFSEKVNDLLNLLLICFQRLLIIHVCGLGRMFTSENVFDAIQFDLETLGSIIFSACTFWGVKNPRMIMLTLPCSQLCEPGI